MEQLIFELAAPEPPSFGNFVIGRNVELVAMLSRIAAGAGGETGLVIWGAAGSGKTHLLRAAVAAAATRGARASWIATPGELLATDPETLAQNSLLAVDAIDAASAEAQARLFTLFNALKANGGQLLAASRAAPAVLPLREDLRTRLGWGLVYELLPLTDAEKPAALVVYARERGFDLSADVIGYLLAHGRRDMTTLVGALGALDRHSLATKRPITVPMLREWLQQEVRFGNRDDPG
jgi:DnaA family protein